MSRHPADARQPYERIRIRRADMSTAEPGRGGTGTADPRRGGTTTVEPRLTRTSVATAVDGRTGVTSTSVTTARRGRALVGAVVWWAGAWRATREALSDAADWS